MSVTKAIRPYKHRKLILSGFLCMILCVIADRALCKLPQLKFAVATSENIIDLDDLTSSYQAMSLSSGGAVLETNIDGKPALMVASFGQPFAGSAYSVTARNDLINEADVNYTSGADFLTDPEILRMGMVNDSYLDDLVKLGDDLMKATYSKADLDRAEEAYRRALFINPYWDEPVVGILKTRNAQAKKVNLVWDIRRRHQLRLRLTDSAPSTGAEVLEEEIQILKEIADNQKESIAFLLELFSDAVFRGPGALLRGEFSIIESDSDVVAETLRLLFSAGRRYAETQLQLGRKRLLLNFFTEGGSESEESRAYALDQIAKAHAYTTELIRLLNPFTNESFYETSEALGLTAIQIKLNELVSLMEQGYNPFGFLPDFVPFLTGDSDNNNLSTFNKLYVIADKASILADAKESEVKRTENKFAENYAEYQERLLEIETSYNQRLKSLIGVVVKDGEEMPDVFTFLIPDRDIDGDGVSERDKERASLTNEWNLEFRSKGQISLQYDNIADAEGKIDEALNDIQNVVKEIEIREKTAQDIFGIQEDIAKLIKDNGEEVSVRIRQKGRLQKEASKRIADKQRKSNLFGFLLEGGKVACEHVADAIFVNTVSMAQSVKTADGEITPQFVEYIIAGLGALLSGIDSVQQGQAAGDITEIQGQLAEDLANIDAQINEIQAMTNADIELARGRQDLLRTEQEVKLLMLNQAKLTLNKATAERNLNRQVKALLNIVDEAKTLLVDLDRTTKLAEENFDGLAIGWVEEDVRDVLTNEVVVADQAFYRAQVWTFIALRALEYYANRQPDVNGQPDWQIRFLYEKLYSARRAQDLLALLGEMFGKATSDFVFTLTSIACPLRGLLSLKYDAIVPTIVQYGIDGRPVESGVDSEADYRYRDPYSGQTYAGAQAYQAVFRNALRQGLEGEEPTRKLTLVFGTDLFPRNSSDGIIGDNPFYLASARNAKIIGFNNSNCAGPGVEENTQGIQVNMTGRLDIQKKPVISLKQVGNSYLKHTEWSEDDYDEQGRLIDPLKSITVYSAYQQILPTWLIGDIDGPNPEQEIIGNAVEAVFPALTNGQGTTGGKTLAFTDRAVANDRWELSIQEIENAANKAFLDKIEEMLNSPIPDSINNDFLTDIQLWIGWAYRNPSPYMQMENSDSITEDLQ